MNNHHHYLLVSGPGSPLTTLQRDCGKGEDCRKPRANVSFSAYERLHPRGLCVLCVPSACGSPERSPHTLVLDWEAIAWILGNEPESSEGSRCSQPPSHLSSPSLTTLRLEKPIFSIKCVPLHITTVNSVDKNINIFNHREFSLGGVVEPPGFEASVFSSGDSVMFSLCPEHNQVANTQRYIPSAFLSQKQFYSSRDTANEQENVDFTIG